MILRKCVIVSEFAIVILNALVTASEAACYVAAVDTPTISHLLNFIEAADLAMHQVLTVRLSFFSRLTGKDPV